MMQKEVGCCCALAGQNTRSDWVCLDLFAPLFASRQKVENKHWSNECKDMGF